jgi:hypothetical protein
MLLQGHVYAGCRSSAHMYSLPHMNHFSSIGCAFWLKPLIVLPQHTVGGSLQQKEVFILQATARQKLLKRLAVAPFKVDS